jgi:hypothetical protein
MDPKTGRLKAVRHIASSAFLLHDLMRQLNFEAVDAPRLGRSDQIARRFTPARCTCRAHGSIMEADRLQGACSKGWESIAEAPCIAENEAFEIMLGAPATTVPGLLARLAYLQAIADGEESWMFEDRGGVALLLLDSFTASLKNVGLS